VAGGEGEFVTDFQLDLLVGEFGDTNFRALQVTQQRDETAVLGGDVADQLRASLVLVGRAMGEIEAGNVQAGENKLLDDFWRITCRAQCGYDFGAANGHAQTP